ncbi:hypothetical protein BDW68DRAFT_133843 [Aspergillus falconensis]
MSLSDPKDSERYTEYIPIYAASRNRTQPFQYEENQEQKIQHEEDHQHEKQDREGHYLEQQCWDKTTAALQTEPPPGLPEPPFQRAQTPKRTRSWSMEDQKHEFHRRLMDLREGEERGFSES